MNDRNDLNSRVISFLEYQEEVYGPFHIPDIENEPEQELTEQSQSVPPKNRVETKKDMSEQTQTTEENDIYERVKACQSLEELKTICETADILQTDLEDTRLVFGVGNPNADLMLIGEAPGFHEDKQGEPFVGRAGKLLNDILKAINFKREDVYIANILKHRPPNNRDPLVNERKMSLPILEKQIDLIQPRLILCLGRISAQTLLDTNESMGQLRGDFYPYREKYELMVTYHPAALLRNPEWKRGTWEDVQKLRKRYNELGCKP